MEDTIDLTDPRSALDLSNIRYQLIRLEDTIIFHLIERVQFPLNPTVYIAGAIKIPNFCGSFLDYFLTQQERIHALVRRYQAPDEYAFFPELVPAPILAPLKYPELLHPNTVNFNDELKAAYIKHILPAACKPQVADRGEQYENYGSTAVNDVACLQALSRRIHFGKFVAEAKFLAETEKFTDLIQRRDIKGIMREITNEAVEKQVLRRLELKAKTYGTDPGDNSKGPKIKINVSAVVAMYRDYVIPMTKEVEVEYLLQRLTNPTPEPVTKKWYWSLSVVETRLVLNDISGHSHSVFASKKLFPKNCDEKGTEFAASNHSGNRLPSSTGRSLVVLKDTNARHSTTRGRTRTVLRAGRKSVNTGVVIGNKLDI